MVRETKTYDWARYIYTLSVDNYELTHMKANRTPMKLSAQMSQDCSFSLIVGWDVTRK